MTLIAILPVLRARGFDLPSSSAGFVGVRATTAAAGPATTNDVRQCEGADAGEGPYTPGAGRSV